MESITTLIVTAAALGAAAGLKPTAEQVVKDAYKGFRRVIIDHYADYRNLVDSLDFLSKKPEDGNRQAAFKDELVDAQAVNDPGLIEAARAVHAAVRAHSSDVMAAIGMDIAELNAAVLEAENVQAGDGGTAVRIGKADIEGAASFRNIGSRQSSTDPN